MTKVKKNERKSQKRIDGLPPKWIKFLEEYMNNGFNGTEAYKKVYEINDRKTASAAAARLLGNVRIRAEIDYRLTRQTVTEAAIICRLWEIAQYRDVKRINSAVHALGLLARARGMFRDNVNPDFTAENPAIVTIPVSPERAEEILRTSKRIEE